MRNLIIFHFLPIENYPPVLNLLNILNKTKGIKTVCITTKGAQYEIKRFENIKIIRLGNTNSKRVQSLNLYLTYFIYNFVGFIVALFKATDSVLYYETLSSFIPVVLKKIRNKTQLLIHFHEYTSKNEYEKGSAFTKWLNKLEHKIYDNADWISHTNNKRLELFIEDNKLNKTKHLHILPNYPPQEWQKYKKPKEDDDIVRIVYVGYTLCDESMYAKELITRVSIQKDSELHFYLVKQSEKHIKLKHKLKADNVFFHPAVKYYDLPKILPNYDIGVILYKGITKNYKYNAPNKLFEYLAFELDVLFPKEMEGCNEFITSSTYPKVTMIDFSNINNVPIVKQKINKTYKPLSFWAEETYKSIINITKSP